MVGVAVHMLPTEQNVDDIRNGSRNLIFVWVLSLLILFFFMKTTPMLSNTIFLADSIIRSFHICFIQRYSFTLFDMILRFQAYEYGIVHCKMLLAVYIQLADCVLSGAQITIKLIIS